MPNWPPAPISGGVAEPLVVLLDSETHRWVEIRTGEGRLVSVIEVLSPSNKSDSGQAAYRRRQRAYLSGKVNLIQIDLLRKGEWVLSLPLSELPESARAPYIVCVHRAGFPDQREVYSLRLRERLPAIRIPLRFSDADIALDLQIIVDQVFERGRYWMLDYGRTPEPSLTADDQLWADKLLRQSGLRS
jgi:hypothetical protein